MISFLDEPDGARDAGYAILDMSWHWRLGPLSVEHLKTIVSQNLDPDLVAKASGRIKELEAAR